MTAPSGPRGGDHTAPFATRILFEEIEPDGRFELQLLHDGEVIAYAMVDADLADLLSREAASYAARCRSMARAHLGAGAARTGGGRA